MLVLPYLPPRPTTFLSFFVLSSSMLGRKARKFRRFSPLLLDEGEYYFDDYAAFAFGSVDDDLDEALRSRLKGRLKLCSKSLFFEPEDEDEGIRRYTYRDIQTIEPCWLGAANGKEFFAISSKR